MTPHSSAAPALDVIIPCFNAQHTLPRAVQSVLAHALVQYLWLIDDASTDGTWSLMQEMAHAHGERVRIARLPSNAGVAAARNHGVWRSQADYVAFLDADDAYAEHAALDAACMALSLHSHLGLVRLALHPEDFPEHYVQHAGFATAWQSLQMTVGGNMVWRRAVLLACGGFPEDALFRRLGGEDAALGIALTRVSTVGTLFDEPGVRHFFHPGMHAEHLLQAHLYAHTRASATADDMAHAEAVTARICRQLLAVRAVIAGAEAGICPLTVQRNAIAEGAA